MYTKFLPTRHKRLRSLLMPEANQNNRYIAQAYSQLLALH